MSLTPNRNVFITCAATGSGSTQDRSTRIGSVCRLFGGWRRAVLPDPRRHLPAAGYSDSPALVPRPRSQLVGDDKQIDAAGRRIHSSGHRSVEQSQHHPVAGLEWLRETIYPAGVFPHIP